MRLQWLRGRGWGWDVQAANPYTMLWRTEKQVTTGKSCLWLEVSKDRTKASGYLFCIPLPPSFRKHQRKYSSWASRKLWEHDSLRVSQVWPISPGCEHLQMESTVGWSYSLKSVSTEFQISEPFWVDCLLDTPQRCGCLCLHPSDVLQNFLESTKSSLSELQWRFFFFNFWFGLSSGLVWWRSPLVKVQWFLF